MFCRHHPSPSPGKLRGKHPLNWAY